MEDTSPNKHFVKRTKKKKATVNESLKIKKFPIHQPNHRRSNSEHKKKIPNQSLLESGHVIKLITKGPSINKLFFKNDNVSLKSDSVPKTNKKLIKKFKSIHIDKGKNDIYNNITIKKKYDNMKNSNIALNYYNMDCIEKIHNLKGVAKDFHIINKDKKLKKPNYINKNCLSNEKLFAFNKSLKSNPMFELYEPLKEKEKIKKPLHKIQSVNQEKRQYKFSDFKVIEDLKKEEEDEDDESLENINPNDYREGNNIQLIEGNSLSEEKDESSSLSSDDNNNKEKEKKEKKKKKSDKLTNLINQSIKDEKKKIERYPSQNNYNSNYNSEAEENYFKNDTKFFMSPKVNSGRPSNKSLKSDTKSDYFNNNIAYFNDLTKNDDALNKNSIFGGPVNKNKIRKNISIATNSYCDYEGDNEEGYDLSEYGNKIVNNLTANDSYINIKSSETNNQINNDNLSNIQVINSINNNDNKDNMNNNIINSQNALKLNNQIIENNENNDNKKYISSSNMIKNTNSRVYNNNNTNNAAILNQNEFPRNIPVNFNPSNVINIHNMNNFNNNNYIFGNNNDLNGNEIYHNLNNNINISVDKNIGNNIKRSQSSVISDSRPMLMNRNNLYNYQENINSRIDEQNYISKNYIMNTNIQNDSIDLNQLNQNNQLINENNNNFMNYDINYNQNRYLINNSNHYQPVINNTNMSLNNNYDSIYNNINNKNNQLFFSNNIDNNNNININYLNYINSQNNLNNELNNNMNSIFLGNNQINYNSQKQNQKKRNNYINPNMININNKNITTPNLNQLQYNYINQNNNMNLNNNNLNINNSMNLLNIINSMNSPMIQNNLNINPNINNAQNSNFNLNDNYKMINPMGNINQMLLNNNLNNNIQNKQNNYPSNKQKKQNLNLLSNEELAKQAPSLAKYQNGCRYLQKRVENNPNLVRTVFFPNILGRIAELSNDQFGNYYIKILIKYLPNDMIYTLIKLIHPSITKIGTNQYGTKVLQYLIEFLNDEKNLEFFIEKSLPHIVDLVNDLNGIHIVQRLICIDNKKIQLIYDKIFENIKLIAVTRDGSNFIKKLIEYLDERNMVQLINAIDKNLSDIITNQCGNYIIQNIILKDDLNLKFTIIETIIKNIVDYSNQKFSSNVVEKCLDVEEMKNKVIDEIIKNNNFEQILLNEYGNYVVQKALSKSDQNKQYKIFKLLVPLIHKLQCLPFGQKLLAKLFILYPRLSIFILNSGEQL